MHGFDNKPKPRRYGRVNLGVDQRTGQKIYRELTCAVEEPDDGECLRTISDPLMCYHECDLSDLNVWNLFLNTGHLPGAPKPDIILGSPPCTSYTRLRGMGSAESWPLKTDKQDLLPLFLQQLDKYVKARFTQDTTYIPICLENVPESRHRCPSHWYETQLCGTMFGLQVFRHRRFISNTPIHVTLQCNHDGKVLGTRGMGRSMTGEPNMFGPYSSIRPGRGNLEDWSRAMGFSPGEFKYADLIQAIPLPYGRLMAAQMVSAYLSMNLMIPRWTRQDLSVLPGAREKLSIWMNKGWRLPDEGTTDLFSARTLLAQTGSANSPVYTMDSLEQKTRKEQRPSAHAERMDQYARTSVKPPEFNETTPPSTASSAGPWSITLPGQLVDPQLERIHRWLTAPDEATRSKTAANLASMQKAKDNYHLGADGRLYVATRNGPKIVVPAQLRYDLLRAYHVLPDFGHRSGPMLKDTIANHYDWPGLDRDCDLFVSACEVCNARRTHGLSNTEFKMREDPPFPFHTICLDYADAPRKAKGSDFQYILVVVCALTRFTLFLPAKAKTAEDTFELLAQHVFPIFSRPHVIVSDNGPEFSNLFDVMQKYIGYRMVHTLGYSAFANGQAEQGVRRIKEMLAKHTHLYKEWDRAIPMLSSALNAARHTSTGLSPFEALFGRLPTTIAELEDPTLTPYAADGNDYVDGLRTRIQSGWDAVRRASYEVRKNMIDKENAHRVKVTSTRDIVSGSWVMLKHGSDQHAALLRKHGYPSFRKYRVLTVNHSKGFVELEVPQGETILSRQSLRRVIPIPASWWISDDSSMLSGRVDGPATTVKTARGNPFESGGALPDQYQDEGDLFYPVSAVIAARPVIQRAANIRKHGRRWEYLVHYTGYPEEWWQSQESLSDATEDVQRMMTAARERYVAMHGNVDANGRPLISTSPATTTTRPRSTTVRFNIPDDDEVPNPPVFWDRAPLRSRTDRTEARKAQQNVRVQNCMLQLLQLFQ